MLALNDLDRPKLKTADIGLPIDCFHQRPLTMHSACINHEFVKDDDYVMNASVTRNNPAQLGGTAEQIGNGPRE